MRSQTPAAAADASSQPTPWWRVGFVWLVFGGPLTVVVASLVTVAIAVSGAEEVLTAPSYGPSAVDSASVPAMQARNHVATPKP